MKVGLYSVKDRLTEFDVVLTSYTSDEVAARAFLSAVRAKNTIMSQNPSDFMIYKVGEYDSSTGIVTQVVPTPVNLDIVSRETNDSSREV